MSIKLKEVLIQLIELRKHPQLASDQIVVRLVDNAIAELTTAIEEEAEGLPCQMTEADLWARVIQIVELAVSAFALWKQL